MTFSQLNVNKLGNALPQNDHILNICENAIGVK